MTAEMYPVFHSLPLIGRLAHRSFPSAWFRQSVRWLSLSGLAALMAMSAGCSGSGGGSGGGGGGGGGAADNTPPTATLSIPNNSPILTTDALQVVFSETMDTASITGGLGIWSASNAANDTYTFTPLAAGPFNRTITAKDLAGNPMAPLVLGYGVYDAFYYVSTTGNIANNGTSPATPMLTIPAAIAAAAAGQAVKVSAGTYQVTSGTDHVVLKSGVSVYGGYSADFLTRDRTANTTTIQDIQTAAGTPANPNRAVEASTAITGATVLDGFTINGSTASPTGYNAAIYNTTGGAPTLSNNTLNGGAGVESYGVFNDADSAPTLTGNTLSGGSGTTNYAVYHNSTGAATFRANTIQGGTGTSSYGVFNWGTLTLIGNTIRGGSGGTDSYGVTNLNALTLADNSIDGGGGGANSYGVYNWVTITLTGNTIDGGRGTAFSYGVYDFGTTGLYSNVIAGGGGSASHGIFGAAGFTAFNNTVDGGTGVASSTAVYFEAAGAAVKNNILFTSAAAGNRYCVFEAKGASDPLEFANNDLFGCPTALYWNGGTTAVNDLVTAVVGVSTLADLANIGDNPAFVNQAGRDLHLQASSPLNVRRGGVDLSATVPLDRDGINRTAPMSMGAYEQN